MTTSLCKLTAQRSSKIHGGSARNKEGIETGSFVKRHTYFAFSDMVQLFVHQGENVAVSTSRSLLKKSTQQYLDDTKADWRLAIKRESGSQKKRPRESEGRHLYVRTRSRKKIQLLHRGCVQIKDCRRRRRCRRHHHRHHCHLVPNISDVSVELRACVCVCDCFFVWGRVAEGEGGSIASKRVLYVVCQSVQESSRVCRILQC